ncbi:MAG: tRNA uridine-5-carboxymethylaminomethyl(34) synthesis GTPase MnmE [Anaerorhabdus sp.]|uniref:tRNA uridine-5-carboxymethylaminomethyl(34) synthesis GTPase MnmE n=1 Tax=Anaerorhabdus sp. TaxID=1872524 RepID=UPI002FC99176
MNDTIVAISTSLQEGAISIIRLSGDDAIEIANKIFSRNLTNVPSHTIHYGMIHEDDELVDEVLVSVFRTPKTYTREDVVEINCHGGVYVTRKVLSLCVAAGAKIASPGEFTQRAFLNGRIDLTQAEGVLDLIEANNAQNASKAISSVKGSVTRLIQPLCEDLLAIIAHIEVNIDYPEYEDVEQLSQEVVLPQAKLWLTRIEQIIRQAQNSYQLKKGINTVILGKPNVGKSSLLNALLEEDKAIVTDIAGTTRDLVEGVVQCKNVTLNLIDTAGIRDTKDVVEKIGIERSLKALEQAELILVVLDQSRDIDDEDKKLLALTEGKNRIIVYNKSDVQKLNEGVQISATSNDIHELIDEINHRYETQIHDSSQTTLNNERQIGLAIAAKNAMRQAIEELEQNVELDLVTIDLQEAYTSLKEILGEVSREDLLDALFSNFCLGK